MDKAHTSTAVVVAPTKRGTQRLSPNHLLGLAFRLFRFKADRWKRRALFYERHRDYFPRLFAGRFVERCRELEATYRGLAELTFRLPAQDQMVPVRAIVVRRRQARRTALPDRLALISIR